MPNYLTLFNIWNDTNLEDNDLNIELQNILENNEAIEDRFYKDLEFGTGGLRGVIGAGTNRINIYTIRKATQGLSNYLKSTSSSPSVAIAYDSRIKSDYFAKEAAKVFAANGITVHIFSELMPTPTLSFAVRKLKCSAGIVITASHNPAKYNGYKVYGSDGCQITLEAANNITNHISKIDCFNDIPIADFETSIANGTIKLIPDTLINSYLGSVSSESVQKLNNSSDFKIVYTPLNGAGLKCVTSVLKNNGFKNITIVSSQELPDGNFPTCPFPNPEIEEALDEGLKLCRGINADLLLATDPDCDRVGTAVKNSSGDYTLISGNEMGILLFDYICHSRKKNNTMPKNPIAIKTIVTTEMAKDIAQNYDVEIIDVLTGFKFIGEQIGLLESHGEENRYIFGFEESYGYLSGSYVRDKDAVNASLLICEMTEYYNSKNLTLLDVLDSLYKTHGYYLNSLQSIDFEGKSGIESMNKFISKLRNNPPITIINKNCIYISDYKNSITKHIDGSISKINLPTSDVLKFGLADGSSIVIRPSGTEPKLKLYYSVKSNIKDTSINKLSELKNFFNKLIKETLK